MNEINPPLPTEGRADTPAPWSDRKIREVIDRLNSGEVPLKNNISLPKRILNFVNFSLGKIPGYNAIRYYRMRKKFSYLVTYKSNHRVASRIVPIDLNGE